MPHHQHHRGPHPEDPQLFTKETRAVLRRALEEGTFLLDRGYAPDTVLDVVSRRHELRVRQRTALQRCLCSTSQRDARRGIRCDAKAVRGQTIAIDGFNLVIGMEVALSGGLLLRGPDGAYRDLAGLRGSYHPVDETEQALKLLGIALGELGVSIASFYLDRPISNSGRLRQRITDHASQWPLEVNVELVQNPDRELYGKNLVVTSDAAILDRAASWLNLTQHLLETRLEPAWVMDFYEEHTATAFVTG